MCWQSLDCWLSDKRSLGYLDNLNFKMTRRPSGQVTGWSMGGPRRLDLSLGNENYGPNFEKAVKMQKFAQ